jgi:hypothetical protein
MMGRSMSDEGFLKRWSRRKLETRQGQELPPEPEPLLEVEAPQEEAVAAELPAPVCAPDAEELAAEPPRLPTLDDVATLTKDSDFSAFVARGVDATVRRSALKKLFADPHFSTMDRLDVYIDDYTKPSPVSEAMLASLGHAKRLFERAVDDVFETAIPEAQQDQQQPQQPPETETR